MSRVFAGWEQVCESGEDWVDKELRDRAELIQQRVLQLRDSL